MAKCQTCQGRGTGYVSLPPVQESYPYRYYYFEVQIVGCPDCGGSGIEHCCEGLREQPEKND
jgi:hypothetical protein